jgi:hypothetical protein
MQPACTHIDIWTAGPSAIDRPHELLLPLPPYQSPEGCRECARAHLHADVQHIVVDLEEPRGLRPTKGWGQSERAMHHPAYHLQRIALPRTWVNKGEKVEAFLYLPGCASSSYAPESHLFPCGL